MTALEIRIIAALRAEPEDMKALRLKVGCTMAELRLAPSMIEDSAEEAPSMPPPDAPAEPAPAQRRRGQEGTGAEIPLAPVPAPPMVAEKVRAPAPLAAAVREEAEVQAARRRAARALGGGLKPIALTTDEALATMLVEEPADAIRAVHRKWPTLWQRVLIRAREEGERPGPMLFALIERGLEAAHG